MPDLPPMPKPGEVWENDEGERLFMTENISPYSHYPIMFYTPRGRCNTMNYDEWAGWAIRTNARCVLEAKK